jgi:hypothetical protein
MKKTSRFITTVIAGLGLILGGSVAASAYPVTSVPCFVDAKIAKNSSGNYVLRVTGLAACGKYKVREKDLTLKLRSYNSATKTGSGKVVTLPLVMTNTDSSYKTRIKNLKPGTYKLRVIFKDQIQRVVFTVPKS